MNTQNGASIYFNRQLHAMQTWLLKRDYQQAIKALEFARVLYTGTRKDGCTPAFAHQVAVAYGVRVVSVYLEYPEETLCAAFLHDVCEDHGIPVGMLHEHFGPTVAEAVWVLTKKFAGQHKDKGSYYQNLSTHPIAAVVKGADRIHNLHTMQGVFDAYKQYRYIQETENYLLPAIQQAQCQFAGQYKAYQRIERALIRQIDHLMALNAFGTASALTLGDSCRAYP